MFYLFISFHLSFSFFFSPLRPTLWPQREIQVGGGAESSGRSLAGQDVHRFFSPRKGIVTRSCKNELFGNLQELDLSNSSIRHLLAQIQTIFPTCNSPVFV